MLLRLFPILLLCLSHGLALAASAETEPIIPCDPDRKFCGRLSIFIAAAANPEMKYIGGEKGVDSDLSDIVSYSTYSNFHQFRGNSSTGLPSYSFVVSSEPKLRAKLAALSTKVKAQSGYLGTPWASVDSFEELLSDDPEVSMIAKALANLSENSACQRLMNAHAASSVLPFLKTEIFVTGLDISGAVALWDKKGETGNYKDWAAKEHSPVFGSALAQRLRSRFEGAVVQTFLDSCSGTRLAENFVNSAECSSYLSVTDSSALIYFGDKDPPVFAAALPDTGKSIRRMKAKSPGWRSVAELTAPLFNSFRTYTTEYNCGFNDPIFSASTKENPLDAFWSSSADARVTQILNALVRGNVDVDRARALLAAGFVESIPKSELPDVVAVRSEGLLRRIFSGTASMRASYTAVISKNYPSLSPQDLGEPFKAIADCLDLTKVADRARNCKAVTDLVSAAAKGTGELLTPSERAESNRAEGERWQTEEEINFLKARNSLARSFSPKVGEKIERAYEWFSLHRKREISTKVLFRRLVDLWDSYDKFRFELLVTLYSKDGNDGNKERIEKVCAEVNTRVVKAFYPVQQEFFPRLRDEVLETRLLKIEETAKLLVLHEEDIKSFDAKEELRQLANDLSCLTSYPVGPAFDEEYAKQLRAITAAADQTPAKATAAGR